MSDPRAIAEEEPLLFAELPRQEPSPFRETDEHFLQPCGRCSGTGRETCPYPRWHPRHLLWDPTCVKCHGAGRLLSYIGPAIEAEIVQP